MAQQEFHDASYKIFIINVKSLKGVIPHCSVWVLFADQQLRTVRLHDKPLVCYHPVFATPEPLVAIFIAASANMTLVDSTALEVPGAWPLKLKSSKLM